MRYLEPRTRHGKVMIAGLAVYLLLALVHAISGFVGGRPVALAIAAVALLTAGMYMAPTPRLKARIAALAAVLWVILAVVATMTGPWWYVTTCAAQVFATAATAYMHHVIDREADAASVAEDAHAEVRAVPPATPN